jgi:hypothetical protein
MQQLRIHVLAMALFFSLLVQDKPPKVSVLSRVRAHAHHNYNLKNFILISFIFCFLIIGNIYAEVIDIPDDEDCPAGYILKSYEIAPDDECPAGFFANSFPIADDANCPSGYSPRYMAQMKDESCPSGYDENVPTKGMDLVFQTINGVESSDSRGTFIYVCDY